MVVVVVAVASDVDLVGLAKVVIRVVHFLSSSDAATQPVVHTVMHRDRQYVLRHVLGHAVLRNAPPFNQVGRCNTSILAGGAWSRWLGEFRRKVSFSVRSTSTY